MTTADRRVITRLLIEQYILIRTTIEKDYKVRDIANSSFDKISEEWIETGKYLNY